MMESKNTVEKTMKVEPEGDQSPIFAEVEVIGRLIDDNHSLSWEIEKRLMPVLDLEVEDTDTDTEADFYSQETSQLLMDLRRLSWGLKKLYDRQRAFYARLQL